jgi:hypothetical protein
MCLYVFRPDVSLQQALTSGLRDWAGHYQGGLSQDDVLRACPDEVRAALDHKLARTESAGASLLMAVDQCELLATDPPDKIRLLGILYGNLAPRIWPAVQADHTRGAAASPLADPAPQGGSPVVPRP